MVKRLILFVLSFIIFGTLVCSAATDAVFTQNTALTPRIKEANYRVFLGLRVSNSSNANMVYVTVYNSYGRMIDIQPPQVARTRMEFFINPDVNPDEYPLTVKAFVWSATKAGIPFCESYTFPSIKSADDIIAEQLSGFVAFMKQKFPMQGSFMYDLTMILDSIHEDIIADAKNDELIIDRALFEKEYPEAYSKVREMAKELKESGDIDKVLTDFITVIDNSEYRHLSLTLFKLLGVYDYFS